MQGREVRENLFAEVRHLLHDLDEGIHPLAIFNPYLPFVPSFKCASPSLALIGCT
jgi:hypothetical protein